MRRGLLFIAVFGLLACGLDAPSLPVTMTLPLEPIEGRTLLIAAVANPNRFGCDTLGRRDSCLNALRTQSNEIEVMARVSASLATIAQTSGQELVLEPLEEGEPYTIIAEVIAAASGAEPERVTDSACVEVGPLGAGPNPMLELVLEPRDPETACRALF